MIKFLSECREELRKVVWPSREEVLNSTVVVLVAVAIISVFLFGVDGLFNWIFATVINLSTGGSGS